MCIRAAKSACLVEINCETDFVARTAEFQIAAQRYRHAGRGGESALCAAGRKCSATDLEKEKAIYRQQALETGKPEKVVDKIVEGKIERFYSEVCLLEQAFIKDPDKKVTDIVNEAIASAR